MDRKDGIMQKEDYLKMLVEDIHSATMATIGADGHPQTRVIDMMLYDEQCVYFLTAKGKAFYAQLMEQGYVAISATKDKKAVSLLPRPTYRFPCEVKSKTLAVKSWTRFSKRTHICSPSIPAIPAAR